MRLVLRDAAGIFGRRAFTGGPMRRSGPSCCSAEVVVTCCPSIGSNGDDGDHSELELEPGDSELF